jgi:uncharacterized membrane protein YvbJ
MKYCPVCHIDYSDNAEFCKKCEAKLLEKAEAAAPVKTDFKGLIKICLYTGGFIIFIMLVYFIYYLLSK